MKRLALVAFAVMLFQSSAFAIGTAYSGSWYNPDESGHGFALEYTVLSSGAPLVVVYWYVYDTEGNPIFLVGNGEPEGNSVTIDFDAPYGMKFGEFDPETTVRADGGIGVFTFDNPESGLFDYEPSEWITDTYGVSAISTPVVKLLEVEHPNPEIVELQVEREGPQGPKGDPGPQGPRGLPGSAEASGLLMQNGNGQVIGTLVSGTNGFDRITVMTLDGYLFAADISGLSPTGYLSGSKSAPWYETPDCSGQAYTAGWNGIFGPYPGILNAYKGRLFIGEWGVKYPTGHIVQSYYDNDKDECVTYADDKSVYPIREVNPEDYGLELDEDGRLHFPMPIKPAVAR